MEITALELRSRGRWGILLVSSALALLAAVSWYSLAPAPGPTEPSTRTTGPDQEFGQGEIPAGSHTATRSPAPATGSDGQERRTADPHSDDTTEPEDGEPAIIHLELQVLAAEDRAPLPGAKLRVFVVGEVDRNAETDAEGRVTVTHLPNGNAAGRVEYEGRTPAGIAFPVADWSVPSGTKVRKTILLERPEQADGQVVSRVDGQPIAGARVRIWILSPAQRRPLFANETSLTTTTDESGRFRIGPVDGTQEIHLLVDAVGWIQEESRSGMRSSPATTETRTAGARHFTVALDPAGTVQVRVTDLAGSPVPGARVQLLRESGDLDIAALQQGTPTESSASILRGTLADSRGEATFTGLPLEGTYAVVVLSLMHSPAEPIRGINLPSAGTRTVEYTCILGNTSSLSVHAYDADGERVTEGLNMQLVAEGVSLTPVVVDGDWTFDPAPPGEATLMVSGDRFPDLMRPSTFRRVAPPGGRSDCSAGPPSPEWW